jgi:DNA-binding transcriptional LysR family regulator
MNFRQLRYFVAVAEELHFGRAAERLAMSQPPLSQQIMALERELGVQLFTRTKRAVALTHAAKQWLPEVQAVLADAKALPHKLKGLWRGEAGSLAISFVSTADYSALPALLRQYTTQFPNVRIRLQEATSDVQIDALLRDEIDVGIMIPPHAGKLPPALAYLPLQREHLVAAIPADWISLRRIKKTKDLPLKAIADAPLILFPRESSPTLHDAITGYYAANGCSPHFGQQAIQMQTIVSLVSAGLGVALVPESLRKLQRSGVAYLSLGGSKPLIETGLAWRKQRTPSTLTAFLKTAATMPK